MFKGVIFDFNGTLFWDTKLHNKAWDIYLDQYNINLSHKEKHLKLHGKNNKQLINDLFNAKFSDEQIFAIAREKELLYQKLVEKEKLQLADGTIELFKSLQKQHIPYTIVTASDELNVDFFFEYLNLDNWFDKNKVVFADGKLKPKPHPDMFWQGMKYLKLDPRETIIFEDSETGLQSAQSAKPGKIIIVNSNNNDYSHWPYEVIRSFRDVDIEMLN